MKVYGLEQAECFSMAAFQDADGFALALGVVLSIRPGEAQILTPLPDLTRVAGLHIGTLRIDPHNGEERRVVDAESVKSSASKMI